MSLVSELLVPIFIVLMGLVMLEMENLQDNTPFIIGLDYPAPQEMIVNEVMVSSSDY